MYTQEDEAATGNGMVEAVKAHVNKYYANLGENTDPVVVVSAKLESEVGRIHSILGLIAFHQGRLTRRRGRR